MSARGEAAGVRATRLGIGRFDLARTTGEPLGSLDLRSPVRLGPEERWPLETDEQAGLQLDGTRYFAWWQRTGEAMFKTPRQVTLTTGRGAERSAKIAAEVEHEGLQVRYVITHGERRYALVPQARMAFDFALLEGDRALARLRETSSFWTITKKTYTLEATQPVEDLIAAFALLLAITHATSG